MPRHRSISPSQNHHHRSRSPRRLRSRSTSRPRRRTSRDRSPRRKADDRPRKSGGGGFRWKEKPSNDGGDRGDQGRLERGYRDQDKPRRRSPVREGGRRDDTEEKFGRRDDIAAKFGKRDDAMDNFGRSDDVAEKFGEVAPSDEAGKEKKKKKKKETGRTAPVPAGEPMIIVNVNDRLGTKASIPCLASDPIKLFKAQVAARIGREPHEIMLKRQGERPFKDQLTLEDYGVSNGVQLDLEVDTGD